MRLRKLVWHIDTLLYVRMTTRTAVVPMVALDLGSSIPRARTQDDQDPDSTDGKLFYHPVRVRRDLSSFLFQEWETQIMVC